MGGFNPQNPLLPTPLSYSLPPLIVSDVWMVVLLVLLLTIVTIGLWMAKRYFLNNQN